MLHADRIEPGHYRLPPPRVHEGTGGRILAMALAVPGVMDYPEKGFSKYVAPSVLSDLAWLATFEGAPVVDDDQRAHAEGVDTSDIRDEAIGTMLRAWWDDEQQVVIGEAIFNVERGLQAIARGVIGVSPAYPSDPPPVEEVGEVNGMRYTRREVRRGPVNNVAITLNPRGVRTHLQADSIGGRKMTPFLIALAALAAQHGLTADAEGKTVDPTAWAFDQLMRGTMGAHAERDAMKAECDAMKAKMADMIPKPAEKTDEEEAAEEEADAAKLKDAADALTLADAFQVAPEDRMRGLAHLQRAILVAAKVPDAGKLHGDAIRGTLIGLKLGVPKAGDFWSTVKPLQADAERKPNPLSVIQ